MTFLTKVELIKKVAKATYRATEAGSEYLKSHPETITLAQLENDIPGYEVYTENRAMGEAMKEAVWLVRKTDQIDLE